MRLALAILLSAGVLLLAQVNLGPVEGLLVPVWDALYQRYSYLTIAEFKALLDAQGTRFQLPGVSPIVGPPATIGSGTPPDFVLDCIPSNGTMVCTWK
jgi:hypothetical protein